MRSFLEIVSDNPWQRSYALAVVMSAMLLGVSMMVYGYGVESTVVNGIVAALICFVGFFCGTRMVLAGAILGPLPYFMIGCAVFYGAGTVIAILNPELMEILSFSKDVQRVMLAKINLANALGFFLVIVAAAPLCAWMRPEPKNQPGMRDVLNSLEPSLPAFLLISAIVASITWVTFPSPGNFVASAVLRLLSTIPLFTILLGAIMWDRVSGAVRLLVVLLAISSSLLGLVGLTKLFTLLPWVILTLGWWLNGRMAKAGIALLLAVFAFHFLLLSNLTAVSRTHTNYEPGRNTVQERVVIILNSFERIEDLRRSDVSGNSQMRFSTAPFQAYFMTLYDTGFPGDSFEAAKTILIPRFFWRDKPIFAPGSDFDLAFRGRQAESSLAIGIFSEGYWNAGWLGIIIVSLTIGIQLGWFTRKWLLFTQYGAWHIGAFILAPVVVYSAAWAEVNFVGGYVGGTVRTAIIMMLIDLIARAIISYRRAQLRI